MGGSESKERALFIDIAKYLVTKRGTHVGTAQLKRFFHFVQECAPWFPEQGILDVKTWKKLGDAMHAHHRLYGNEKVPAIAFALWNLFRDCLDPRHESEQLSKRGRSPDEMSEKEPLLTA